MTWALGGSQQVSSSCHKKSPFDRMNGRLDHLQTLTVFDHHSTMAVRVLAEAENKA